MAHYLVTISPLDRCEEIGYVHLWRHTTRKLCIATCKVLCMFVAVLFVQNASLRADTILYLQPLCLRRIFYLWWTTCSCAPGMFKAMTLSLVP